MNSENYSITSPFTAAAAAAATTATTTHMPIT